MMQCCRGLREGLRGAFAPAELVLHGEYRRTSQVIEWHKPMPRAADILAAPPLTKLGLAFSPDVTPLDMVV